MNDTMNCLYVTQCAKSTEADAAAIIAVYVPYSARVYKCIKL
jgi:hypothetical protein